MGCNSDAILRAGLFLCALAASGFGQISPGILSRAHSTLNGPGHCTDCHDKGKSPPEFKCLDCHRDIGARLQAGRGMHPALVGADRTGRSCAKCHSEHNGVDFETVHWETPVEKFDHRKTGYVLEGKHAGLACKTCHQPEHIPSVAKASIVMKDLTRTYLGLSRNCIDCHADRHEGQLSHDCATCHDFLDWKAAPRFDHKRTHFVLTGAHERVACGKCHPVQPGPKPTARYSGLRYEDCAPCHADPHRGVFRGSCRSCHDSTAGWKPARVSGGFDHGQTRYPLTGKHAGVACEACHPKGNFKEPLAFAHCTDCHKTDPHHGQFANRADGGDCAACHSVSGFKPSTFGAAEHAATRFALRGRHSETACAKCHVPNPKGVVFRIEDTACSSCHRDPHGGQFRDAPYQNRCEGCHSESGFKPSTFTPDRHASSAYPLTGAHATVPCAGCHKLSQGEAAIRPVPYRFSDRTCAACHTDPHQGQFVTRMKAMLPGGTAAGCQACHHTSSWHDLPDFDHASTGFQLEGAHRKIPCARCHKPADPSAGIGSVSYAAAPRLCAGCHDDVHGGQFSSGSQTADCGTCHSPGRWKPSLFDHDRQSAFKLEGAHRTAPCMGCHKAGVLPGGSTGIMYRSTSRRCADCHSDVHGGQFSIDAQPPACDRCHQVQQWKPSAFDHNTQSAFKLEGAHRDVACPKCHTTRREVAGKSVLFYKPTPHRCSDCHGFETIRGLL